MRQGDVTTVAQECSKYTQGLLCMYEPKVALMQVQAIAAKGWESACWFGRVERGEESLWVVFDSRQWVVRLQLVRLLRICN